MNGTRTFFRVNAEDNAGAYQAFVLQDEAPAGVSVNVTQELVDYSAYDLQTEKRVTIRSRKVDGFYREKESTCNRIMGARVHDYFKVRFETMRQTKCTFLIRALLLKLVKLRCWIKLDCVEIQCDLPNSASNT